MLLLNYNLVLLCQIIFFQRKVSALLVNVHVFVFACHLIAQPMLNLPIVFQFDALTAVLSD